jgi:hypothetical protein
MGVTSIVTGHYLKEGDQLEVTLEAVDVANNRSVWRDTINVTASDNIAMRDQVTSKVRQGLVPALGGSSASSGAGTRPKSEEAYDLYLRSIAVPHDVAPNKDAISMLERAVGIDPSYAPAWEALGLRYYFDASYGDGGKQMLRRSDSAFERAIALDPNLTSATGELITNRVDEGELANAYAEATALVKRRPQSAIAHFVLSYVLRYAGLLQDAARECDTAVAGWASTVAPSSRKFTYLQNPWFFGKHVLQRPVIQTKSRIAIRIASTVTHGRGSGASGSEERTYDHSEKRGIPVTVTGGGSRVDRELGSHLSSHQR